MTDENMIIADEHLLDETGIAVMVAKVDENGLIIVVCNEASTRMCGYAREDIIGSRPESTTHNTETDHKSMQQALRSAKTGKSGVFASRFTGKDGLVFAARCMVTGRFDDTGKLTQYVFVSTAIAEDNPGLLHFDAHGLLAQAEQVGGTGAWRYDILTDKFVCSDNCYAMHGLCSKTDSIDRLLALFPPEEQRRLDEAARNCRKSGKSFEMECTYYRDDGTRRDGLIAAQPEFNDNGDVIALVGVLRDETEMRNLRRKQEMFLRAAEVGFVEVDLQAETITYSAEGGTIIGADMAAGQMTIAEWKERVHPEDYDETWDNFTNSVTNKTLFIQKYRFLAETGEYRWIVARAAARMVPGRNTPIIIGTIANINAKILANKELADTHARLDIAVASAELGVWSWDLRANNNRDTMSWSPHMHNILGLDEDDQASWPVMESLIHPEERNRVGQEILATIESSAGGGFGIEHRCIRPDGSIIWVENRGLARHDDNGQAIAIAGVLQDITERKRAETELVKSEQRFNDVANFTGECIFEADTDLRIAYVSSAVKQIYGYEPEELIGKTPIAVTRKIGDDPKAWRDKVYRDGGWKDVEREIIRKDGSTGWVILNGRALKNDDGEITGFRGAINDITERKASLEKLVQSERRVNDVVRIAGGCIFDLDTDGYITYVSDSAKRQFGVDPEDLIGKPTYALAPELEPRHQEWLGAIRHSDGGLESEMRVTPLNGESDRWMRITCRLLTDDTGKLIGYRGIAFDVTARKQAALEIIKAKKAAEATAEGRARFLSTMSHEIRTPLNAVIGMTDLLLEMPQDSEQRRLTNSANTAGRHLLGLVNDILDFSKLDAGKLVMEKTPFNLHSEISTVHDMLAHSAQEKGLALDVKIDRAAKGDFIGDPSRIRQILINLIGNAIKFTQQGHISIDVGQTSEQRMRFCVTDTGTGIEQDVLPTLFQDFAQADSSVTRKFGGTGLGLAICKRLAEMMDGTIGATSTSGKGSVFWFEIPLSKVRASKTGNAPKSAKPTPEKNKKWHLRVLVAEDNPANQLLIKTILTRMGHELVIAQNGAEAVDIALTEAFDLILMDIQMPILDGVSATRQLRDAGCETPVIALTAHIITDEAMRFHAAGMNDWLSKPIDIRKLTEAMVHWSRKYPQKHVLRSQKTG